MLNKTCNDFVTSGYEYFSDVFYLHERNMTMLGCKLETSS